MSAAAAPQTPVDAAAPVALRSVAPAPDLSVVIAVYNERDSLQQLSEELIATLDGLGMTWEVLFVDDGSNDGSREVQRTLCEAHPGFRAVHLRRNFGKAAALHVGFRRARGRYLVTMDGDLQDVPAEMPTLLQPILDDEADLVSGWKWPRLDPITKLWPSKIYNGFSRYATGLGLHDMNCWFKAYRREVTDELALYGEMHRYIPVLADGAGFIVTERKIAHRPRIHGHSKYAWRRFVRGFLDLLTVLFLTRYRRRPLHLIGGLGLLMGISGFAILCYLTALWVGGEAIGGRPLLMLGVLLVLVSGQFFTFGLLAEMMTYHSQTTRTEYPIRALHGFDDDPS